MVSLCLVSELVVVFLTLTTEQKKNDEIIPDGDKEITISKRDFMEKCAGVLANGRATQTICKRDALIGSVHMMFGAMVISDITTALFDESEKEENDGRTKESGKSCGDSCRAGDECSE